MQLLRITQLEMFLILYLPLKYSYKHETKCNNKMDHLSKK